MINVDDRLIKSGTLKAMGAPAFAVLIAISIHLNTENKAFPSKKRLQALTGLGRDSVTKAVKKLSDMQILKKRQRIGENGRRSSNTYRIKTSFISVFVGADKLEMTEETPHTENQYTEEETPRTDLPYTVEPSTVKQPLSINKSLEVLNSSLEVLTNTLPQKGKIDFLTEEDQNETIPIPVNIDKKEKEKNGAKKEKEEAPALPPGEMKIQTAIKKSLAHFEKYPDQVSFMKQNAKIADPDFDINNQLDTFFRLYASTADILKNPTEYLHSKFALFLNKYNQFNEYSNYGKRTKADKSINRIKQTPTRGRRIRRQLSDFAPKQAKR